MMYVNTLIHTQTYKLELNTTVYIITYRNVSTVAKKFIKKINCLYYTWKNVLN